ncbi:MAG: ABC transporter substrate-binding protein [Pseudomonadota bacterium]
MRRTYFVGRILATFLCWGVLSSAPISNARADVPTVRVAVLKFGTVNWLLDTVLHNKLDEKEGVKLEVVPLAGKAATAIAFQSGDADMLVTDWIWAMRQRSREKALLFHPYSRALGALVTKDITDLCALPGQTIGVVGGELDKSWLVLQALADRRCDIDLAGETKALYGAPPLMSRQLEDGAVAAVSTYWHFVAKLEAKGMMPIVRVSEALTDLGISPAPPLIGFVWDTDRTEAEAAEALISAIDAAGQILAESDDAWSRLRPLMRAKSDAEFVALRDAYRAGTPNEWTTAETASAQKLYDLLTKRAGKAFTDQAGPFDPTVFPGN